jgi:DNA-binding transcriptional LysR family regulator
MPPDAKDTPNVDRPQNEVLDLTTLAIFRAVVRENGVTRAAVRLNRVQSNVTTRIKQLEEALGVALFTREGRCMVLPPEGENLLPYVERLLALAAEACKSIGELKPTGRLRLGAMESTPASRMPSLLASYSREWKAVGIALFFETRDVLVEHLRALKPMPFSSPAPSRRPIGSCSNANRSFLKNCFW